MQLARKNWLSCLFRPRIHKEASHSSRIQNQMRSLPANGGESNTSRPNADSWKVKRRASKRRHISASWLGPKTSWLVKHNFAAWRITCLISQNCVLNWLPRPVATAPVTGADAIRRDTQLHRYIFAAEHAANLRMIGGISHWLCAVFPSWQLLE